MSSCTLHTVPCCVVCAVICLARWHCLTMWFLICLAPDSALILSGLSICDHKGGMKDDATLL